MKRSLFVRTVPMPSRREILDLYEEDLSTREIATRFQISESWARRVKQEHREQGKTCNATTRKREPKWVPLIPRIEQALAEQPDLTLKELKAKLGTELNVGTLCRALKKLKLTLKKKVLKAAEQDRPDVAQQRAEWKVMQAGLDPDRLVFLDETWAKTNMTRPRGRSLAGTRLIAKVPHGHWKTTTFLAALRTSGLTAPLVIDGAVNGDIFLAYVRQQLAPTLHPGDIVIMDNLSSHKKAGVREAIEAADAKLIYLPPYSPDLNPIENAFSKFKRLLSSAEERTVDALWQTCGRLLDQFDEAECRNYFRHCGYRYT